MKVQSELMGNRLLSQQLSILAISNILILQKKGNIDKENEYRDIEKGRVTERMIERKRDTEVQRESERKGERDQDTEVKRDRGGEREG